MSKYVLCVSEGDVGLSMVALVELADNKENDQILYQRACENLELAIYTKGMDERAKKLNDVLENYDPYTYMDCDYSENQARRDLAETPYEVIDHLLKIISDMRE